MQPNLDSYSLASRTFALPVPRAYDPALIKPRSTSPLNPWRELEQARQSVARIATGEHFAWLAVALSALAALVLSLWF
jgi:hypothetical protein